MREGARTVGKETAQFLFMNLFQMPNLRPLSFYLKHSLLSRLPGKQNTVTHRDAGSQLSDVRFRAFLSDFLNPFFFFKSSAVSLSLHCFC